MDPRLSEAGVRVRSSLRSVLAPAALLLLAVSFSCTETTPRLAFEKVVMSDQYEGWWFHTPADLNGDGLLDVVVLSTPEARKKTGIWIGWLEAREGGRRWVRHEIDDPASTKSAGDIEAADFDNDGDLDIVGFDTQSAERGGEPVMFWYENPGDPSESSWKKHFIGHTTGMIKDVKAADFNGDGKLDLTTINHSHHKFHVFRQNTPDSWTAVVDTVITNLHEGMDVGDIDGDGDPDVAANGYWMENPGGDLTGSWTVRSIDDKWHNQSGGWRRNATRVYCRDINGDGLDEVFLSQSETTEYAYPVSWYEYRAFKRHGGTRTWVEHRIAADYRACHSLEVFDMDLDGDFDVFAAEIGDQPSDGRVTIFVNGGNNLVWEPMVISYDGAYFNHVGDLEGDGDFDIFGASGFSSDTSEFYLWLNKTR